MRWFKYLSCKRCSQGLNSSSDCSQCPKSFCASWGLLPLHYWSILSDLFKWFTESVLNFAGYYCALGIFWRENRRNTELTNWCPCAVAWHVRLCWDLEESLIETWATRDPTAHLCVCFTLANLCDLHEAWGITMKTRVWLYVFICLVIHTSYISSLFLTWMTWMTWMTWTTWILWTPPTILDLGFPATTPPKLLSSCFQGP